MERLYSCRGSLDRESCHLHIRCREKSEETRLSSLASKATAKDPSESRTSWAIHFSTDFFRKMTKSSLLETRRIVEYGVIASEFLNLFSRSDRIFCDEIRSKLINLFFVLRLCMDLNINDLNWKIRSVLMKTENIEFLSVVVSRVTSLFDIVLSRYFMYEKKQYSISIVFFYVFMSK